MRKFALGVLLVLLLAKPVNALEFEPPEIPVEAEKYMPEETESFADGIWYIIKQGISELRPDLVEASGICFSVIAVVMFTSMLKGVGGKTKNTVDLVCVVSLSLILLRSVNAFLALGVDTVTEITEYGKLLLPVISGALAANGGITTATALYTGTAIFNSTLSSCIHKLIVPMLYVFMVLCIANNALGEKLLKNLKDFSKWLMTWCLKTVIYVFTGYMSITGVVSGYADATAIKAAKLTISGVVPVVGNIISDASDAVLSSAVMVKNTIGVYGLLAVAAIWVSPFLRVGVHYLLFKATAAICGAFDHSPGTMLVGDYCTVMGYVLAMIGVASLLVLISTVCFMRTVS